MAEYKPNKDQIKFLDASGSNILVSASAGAGKTSTMIQKLVSILKKTKIPISSLLVVTYTNAAASEIKQKLYNELNKAINNENNDKERLYLINQLDNINNAEIGTFHAICKKLLVKYFYETELSPDFTLLSEQEHKYLLDSAIDVVFKDKIKNNDDRFYALYECYNSKRNDNSLKNIVSKLIEFSYSIVDYDKWAKNTLDTSYTEDLNNNLACIYVMEYFKSKISMYFDIFKELVKEAKTLQLDKYASFLGIRMQFVGEYVNAQTFEQSHKIFSNRCFGIKPSLIKNASVEQIDFDDRVVNVLKDFNSIIKDMKEKYISDDLNEIKNSIINSRNNLLEVYNLVNIAKQTYSNYKTKKNCLDFNDLEDKMIELLDGGMCDILKNKYNYIFVDEYQDINEKQEFVLSKLISGDNYYMIGDVKQSIYEFRQASPKIFVKKFNDYSNNKESGKVINFNQNYRSERNILQFVNTIFSCLITKDTIGIDYSENSKFETDRELVGGKVRLNIINNFKKMRDEDDDNDEDTLENNKKEAIVIADQILQICKTFKSDGKRYNYGDIAVILRGGALLNTLCKTLTSMQIPIKATIKNNYLDSIESQILISVLKVISNYKDEISACVVLKNLFGITEQELVEIAQLNQNLSFSDNLELVFESNENINNSKVKEFFEFISESKQLLTNMTISEYLYWVVDRFDLLLKVKCWSNGLERANNILEFIEMTNNSNFDYNIEKFLDYLDFVLKKDENQTVGGGSNAVTVCTIHHSKGLEFPVVILAGMGKKFQLNKDTTDFIKNNKFGVGLKSIDPVNRVYGDTIIRMACKLDNKKTEIDEEIRLLYVAMTRPKDILSMVGLYDLNDLIKIKQKSIYDCNNFLEFILKSIDEKYLDFIKNMSNIVIYDGKDNECEINVIESKSIVDDSEKHSDLILSDFNSKLKNVLDNLYQNTPSIETHTIKNTVTNVLREEVDYENLNSKPKLLSVVDGVDNKQAMLLGTAYHTIMQNLKFNENKANITEIINTLINVGIISSDVAKLINVEQILCAINVLRPIINSSKTYYQEKQFLMRDNYNNIVQNSDNVDKVIIQGVIDLVVVGDQIIIVDYKTNKTKNEKILIDEYGLQLKIYKNAFEKATKLKVDRMYIYSFEMGKLIEIK